MDMIWLESKNTDLSIFAALSFTAENRLVSKS